MDKKKLKVILEVLSNVSVKYRGVARVFFESEHNIFENFGHHD